MQERTRELEEEKGELAKKVGKLEKFHKLVVGRELRMAQLKKEVKKLKK